MNMEQHTMNSGLDHLFGAFANSVRRLILERLASGEATVGELTELCRVTMPAISRHLNVLNEAGLISRRVEGRFRYVSLNPEALAPAHLWLKQLPGATKGSLADYLEQLRTNG